MQRKFVHVSFRIPVEAKAGLEKEADRRGINVNALVSEIFVKYTTFDRIVDYLEVIPLNKLLLTRTLDKVDAEDMERLGKELGPKAIKRAFEFLGLEFSLNGIIEHYFRPLATYSRWYSFNVTWGEMEQRLLFEHHYGAKWSAFLGHYIAEIVKSATGSEPRITVDDELVVISCQVKRMLLETFFPA